MTAILTDPASTVNQRIDHFLKESDDLGVIFRKAAIVAAIATNESADTFGIARPKELVFPNTCLPTRQILLLEEGNPALGTKMKAGWTQDPELMKMLAENNFLGTAGDVVNSQIVQTDSIKSPNNSIATIFEWLIDRRKAEALGAFSIGPTQMFLRQSKMAGGIGPNHFTVPSFPDDIEELWDFYTAPDYAMLWTTGFWDYLPVKVASYPTPSSTTCQVAIGDTCVETYLQSFQTGTLSWATTHAGYAARFKNAVDNVWNIARKTGYNNDSMKDINKPRNRGTGTVIV